MADRKSFRCHMARCLLAVLAAALAAGGMAAASADTSSPKKESRNTFENQNYIMNLDEETLGITLTDRKTGYVYESVIEDESSNDSWKGFLSSGISVELCTGKGAMPERVDLVKGKAEKVITSYEDGFDADIRFPSYDFSIGLQVRLKGDGFSASVKQESIREGENYMLAAVYLYPMFGATKKAEKEGYLLIPEGSGAIISLEDNHGKFKTPYSKKIYGPNVGTETTNNNYFNGLFVKEPKRITVPVFGMAYTGEKQGFLGIIEEGQYNADILAYPNGATTDYNWVTAKYNYREVYTMQTAASSGVPAFEKNPYMRDLSVSYKLVNGNEADYTGLARRYQQYLVQRGDLRKQEDQFRIKLDFFGADTKKWFIFNQVVPMTTVSKMEEIIDKLREKGVMDIQPVYTGWQSKGISLNYGSGNFKLEGKLGSRKELDALAAKLEEQEIRLVLQQDFLQANPKRFYNTARDIVKGINQMLVEKSTNAGVFPYMYYLTPGKTLSLAKKWADRYKTGNISAIALASVPDTLFSFYSGGKIYSRGDTARMYEETMEALGDFQISMENPYEYLWKYTSQYYDLPLSTSNYSYISKEVPFLPIVLRGYLPYWGECSNFKANETEYFLKMLEYGAYPDFLLTGESPEKLRNTNSDYIYTSEYEVLEPMVTDYYNRIGSVLRLVEGVGIRKHAWLTDSVVSVEYDNGVELLINYSASDYQSGAVTVEAMSFQVIRQER